MPESGRAMGGVPDVARRATAVLSASALAASCHGPTAAFCCCRSHPSERSRLGPRWDAIRWGSPFAQRLQPQLCLTLAYGSAARWVGRRAGAAAREGRAPLGGPASGPSLLPSENTQLQLRCKTFDLFVGTSLTSAHAIPQWEKGNIPIQYRWVT